MSDASLIKEEFLALRSEIENTKRRLVMTVWLGLTIVPVLTFLAEMPDVQFVGPLIPFVTMVLTILFVSEEHALMRCGRYIRERIDPRVEAGGGWESWLEAQPELRAMDRYFFGCFLITFFAFYFGSVGLAIRILWTSDDVAMSGESKALAGAIVYGIGALWMLITVGHHWRACTRTTK